MVFIRIPTFFWKSTAKKLRALQNCSLMPRLSETWSKLDANAETASLYRQTGETLTHCSMAGSCSVAIVQPHATLQCVR